MESNYTSLRRRVTTDCGDELITKQEFKHETDINNIISQFKRTGIITHISKQIPSYQDLPDQMDYQDALALSMQAEAAFATLPSTVRRYFENDPSKLLAAIGDPSQRSALEQLGILKGPDNPQPAGNPDNVGNPPVPHLAGTPQIPVRSASPQMRAQTPSNEKNQENLS